MIKTLIIKHLANINIISDDRQSFINVVKKNPARHRIILK